MAHIVPASTRTLPATLAQLRAHWLPPKPTGTAVTRLRDAIGRLDDTRTALKAELAAIDHDERLLATALADAAENGDDPGQLLAEAKPTKRAALVHRLELLRRARSLAMARHAEAERTDPEHTAWLRQCEQITEAWQQAIEGEAEQRVERLIAFTSTYNPW